MCKIYRNSSETFSLCEFFTSTYVLPLLVRILVPDYGFMHLELIPMLIGFFTYKIAMFAQAIQESFPAAGNREV
jgi:hypothetical protein